MSDIPKRRRLPRVVKALIWLASATLAYTLAGFLVVPAIVKSQMLKRLPPLTHRQAAVREVKVNPYTFALTVGGLSLTETNGEVFAGLDSLHVQFQALSSLGARAWVFKDVTVTHPFAQITRRKDGSFNFDNLLPAGATNAPAAPASPLPSAVVESLSVTDAAIIYDDLAAAAPFHDKLAPINFQVTQLSTRSNATAPYAFSAVTDAGEGISASGRIGAQPPQSTGRAQLTGLALKRYAPYLADFTTAEILGGTLDGGADYQFALGAKGLEANVTNGAARLAGFQLKAPDAAEPVVSIPKLTVDQAEASLGKKSARVRSIKSSGGSIVARQNQDGTINLLALLKGRPAPAQPPSTNAAPWTAQVDEVAFDSYSVQIEDRKTVPPAKIDARDVAFKVTGFSSALATPIGVVASMRLNGQGMLSITGTATLAPVSADLAVDLAGLELAPFQPYLADKVNVGITSGQVQARGKAHYAAAPAAPQASFIGDVSVTNLATLDPVNRIGLAKLDALAVNGIDFAFQPNRARVREVRLTGLDTTVLVETNRQVNLLNLFPPPAAGATVSTNAAGAFSIALETLALERASLHVLDRSIEPNCALDVSEISGDVKGLSTDDKGPATVKLAGRLGDFSPFSVTGTVDPLAKDISFDLAVSCKNLDLSGFTPYMQKYGGHKLQKGTLLLDLHYDVARRALAATNKITVANLTLGPKNNSPDAIPEPVKLGVALLKDRNGNIILDVPLSGRLDDPKFRVMPIVWQVIRQSIAKAAAAPFTLLGSLVGGSKGEELSYAEFPPGSAVLPAAEEAKIRKLGAALYERPALSLAIAGAVDPSADAAALARERLRRRLQELRAGELAASGGAAPAVDTNNIDAADYPRLVQALYAQTYGADGLPAPAPARPPKAVLAAQTGPQPELITTPIFAHREFRKGGEMMMQHASASSEAAESINPSPAPPQIASASTPPGQAPSASDAADLTRMEERLLADIRVSDDDLRDLEQGRARAVEKALLESGKVSADRVVILPAKTINRSAPGETRANFSVE